MDRPKWTILTSTVLSDKETSPRKASPTRNIAFRLRAKREQLEKCERLSPDIQGQNLALAVLQVASSLDSGYLQQARVFSRRRERAREFFIDNLLVRIHVIIEMIWWTSLTPWDFLNSLFEVALYLHSYSRRIHRVANPHPLDVVQAFIQKLAAPWLA